MDLKRYPLLLMFLFLLSCGGEDDAFDPFADCPVPAIELPEILIELVDGDGTNLIANGTFSPEDIRLEYPNYTLTDFLVGEEGSEIENLIRVFINNLGPQTVTIVLSETQSDPFSFTAVNLASDDPSSLNEFGCPTYQMEVVIEDATYNAQEQTIREFNNDFGDFIVTIVR